MAISDGPAINYRCRRCGESVPGQLYCVTCDGCAGCCHCGKMQAVLDRIRDTLPEAELGFEVCPGCEECFQLDELCLCCRRCLGCCRCPKPT